MQEIFEKSAILINEAKQTDFKLFHQVSDVIIETLEETLLIYGKVLTKALNLNKKDGYFSQKLIAKGISAKDLEFFNTDLKEEKEKFPLILAPLCLHKVSNINETMIEIRELLNEKGIFIGTFFGLGNLEELGKLLASEDIKICGQAMQRLLPLIDIKTIGSILTKAGFKNIVIETIPISFEFESLKSALQFLKNSGEGNVLKVREKSFISGSVLKKYVDNFAKITNIQFELSVFVCHI